MRFGLIPIVYGGSSKADYESLAPPHSLIHALDYKSPRGEFLKTYLSRC